MLMLLKYRKLGRNNKLYNKKIKINNTYNNI